MTWTWKYLLPLGGIIGLGIAGYILLSKKHIQLPQILQPTIDRRAAIVNAALSQVGSGDAQKYWNVVAPGVTANKNLSWCGGFALWAIKQGGIAADWLWQIGKGFLSRLPITKTPLPGDIAYFANHQHHAVVQSVNPDGSVNLINGNGTGGKVSLSKNPKSSVTAFYSIQPLLSAA
jgi:hypothetical protein